MRTKHTVSGAGMVRAFRLACACGACGAAVFASPSARACIDDGTDPLRGPSVSEKPKNASLIERDFAGHIKRPDTDPALAALEKLKLSPEEKAATEKIVAERDTIIDQIVLDNLKLLVQLNNARQSGDKAGTRQYVAEAAEKLKPLTSRGRLVEELKGALAPANAAELARLVDEYRAASIDDRMKAESSGKGGEAGQRLKATAAEFLEGYGQEVRRSYERVIGSRAKDFDALIKSLSLTPEQEGKVRQLVTDLVQKTSGKATPAQRSKVFVEIYKVLNAEQRTALIEKIAEQRRLGREPGEKTRETPDAKK